MWEGERMHQQIRHRLKSDFDVCNWQKVIEQCDQKECRRYAGLFFIEAEKAEQAADAKLQEIFSLLGRIASLHFKLDNDQDPFGPMFVLDGRRSFIVDDLTDDHTQILTEVVSEVADPEMRARVADVLYIKTRDTSFAGLAIDAYLASAATLLQPEHWVSTEERIERALQLAARIGRNNHDYFPRTIQVIEDLLGKYGEEDATHLSAKLMGLLIEQRRGEPEHYASLAEMGRIEIPFDVTDEQEKARAQVKGKKFLQALFDLTYIGSSPRVKDLRKRVIENAKQAPLSAFGSVEVKDNTGKTVGRRPPILSNEADKAEQAIRAEMFRLATWYQFLHAINWV